MPAYPLRRLLLLPSLAALALLMTQSAVASSQASERPQGQPAEERQFAIAIHGGAGTIRRENMRPELEQQYRQVLEEALRAGHEILAHGGTSLEAVEAAILIMEDSPLFNAGRGGVFTSAGTVELDASIMDGSDLSAGAVAGVKRIKNPILAAIAVKDQSPHVLLAGEGAETFAEEVGLELVENEYFHTERRRRALEEAQRRQRDSGASVIGIGEGHRDAAGYDDPERLDGDIEGKYGTVGCIALDQHGNLAAGTSTGGLTNKRFGRVGDTPIIGAGNYAENETAAVSCTGQGEFFIRLMIASDLAKRMRYAGASLEEASAAQMRRLTDMDAQGGLISLSREGRAVFAFNTDGMYRGFIGADGQVHVAIYADDDRIPGDLPGSGGRDWDPAFDGRNR